MHGTCIKIKSYGYFTPYKITTLETVDAFSTPLAPSILITPVLQ